MCQMLIRRFSVSSTLVHFWGVGGGGGGGGGGGDV